MPPSTASVSTAWRWRAQEQGEQSNHYPGAIPVDDVQDRLFRWTAQSRRLAVEVKPDMASMTHLSEDGQPRLWAVVPEKQAITGDFGRLDRTTCTTLNAAFRRFRAKIPTVPIVPSPASTASVTPTRGGGHSCQPSGDRLEVRYASGPADQAR
jgi:hypothetical protein